MLYIKGTENGTLKEASFDNEEELERILCDMPSLIGLTDEQEPLLVTRQVQLGRGNKADVLMIDRDARPIMIEVKLGKNAESKREIVGQVFDYVATISDMTFAELNTATKGCLEDTIEKLAAIDGTSDKEIRSRCDAFLRSGNVRVVMVLDKAPEPLSFLMAYMSKHTDLDVRLVEVSKYQRTNPQETMFVPTVSALTTTESRDKVQSEKEPAAFSSEIREVVNSYNACRTQGLSVTSGRANYAQLKPSDWKGQIHYEFKRESTQAGKFLTAQLHCESATVSHVVQSFPVIKELIEDSVADASVEVDETWYSRTGGGRIIVQGINDASPDATARLMDSMILATRGYIDELKP